MAHLADIIEAQLGALLKQWSARVGASLAPGRPATPELADHLPVFLRQIIAMLREPARRPSAPPIDGSIDGGREHGDQRFRAGFELEAVVREYGLLLHLVLELIEVDGASVSMREVRRLSDFVTDALVEATAEHARRLAATAQAEAAREEETEARRMDDELRIFRAVLDASSDFIAFGKPGGLPDYVNPAGVQLVGLASQEAARALTVADYYTPETRDATLARMIPLLRAGQRFQGETELRHFGTGEAIPVSQAAFTVNDASGRPIVLAAVLRDRREQRRAEAEREQLLADAQAARGEADLERERLVTAFTQAPVAVGILRGDDDVVVLANDAICRIWGVPHRAVIGRPLFELLIDAKEQGFPELLATTRRTGTPFVGREVRVTLPRPGGGTEDIFLNFVYQPLRAVDGSVTDILAVATDVTVEVEARRAAEASSAAFEAMCEELEKRTEFEQHLLGIVSHDLRNPLGAILLGATGLLEMDAQNEWVTRIAQRIHASAERSTRMISDLLDFTQARLGGGIRLERRPADLYTLVSTTIEEVEAAYPDRTVDLGSRTGDTHGTWDADRIVQVVTNLVTNALKYSPARTPVVVRATGHGSMVELTLHNECPPIPPERISRLFEPLQRATDQIDLKTRSVGLGLYIVDAIVRAHGGTVGVVSTAEAGTTFTVRLPRELGA